jgi:murein DD-endopeptidase MepM/ murein hydrolase activator NlpD
VRRRRSRHRFAGLVVGAALLGGGFTLLEQSIAPGPEGRRGEMTAPSALATTAKTGEELARLNPVAALPTPADLTASVAREPIAPTEPAAIVVPAPPDTVEPAPMQTVQIRPGDSPARLLTRMGVAPADAQAAVRKLSTVWDPRDLKAGQKAAVFVQSDRLLSIRLALAPGRDVVVARDDTGDFVVEDQDRPTYSVMALGAGTIHTSLSEAADAARVPIGIVIEMIRAFSYDVDFQREIHAGDTFTVLYQRVDDESGRPTGIGYLVYGEMVLSGTRLRLYRYQPADGEPGYYNALGEDIRKALLRTPIDGAHITSGFGMRLHPLLGYSRMHRGVDFGAPTGTAIYAAGDGVVTRAGSVSGYGNYVEIEHNAQYATAYGHLSAFARGLHEGERVRQGEVIGYVGMSGMATGPHLHYEVHYRGAQIDPLSVRMPATTRVAGDDLKAFEAERNRIERQLLDGRQDLVAHAVCPADGC